MKIDIESVIRFHGHLCPGLAIGMRVAEQALLEMGARPGDEEVVAVVETNNCAVDAIQYLTGCTFGKGNLIHLDYGKNAFRFIRRSDGKAVRICVRADIGRKLAPDEEAVMKKWRDGEANTQEAARAEAIRAERIDAILNAPLNAIVDVQVLPAGSRLAQPPARAKIYLSEICAGCGEKTMEPRLVLHEGKLYCPECYRERMGE